MEFFGRSPFYFAVEVEGVSRTVAEGGPTTGLPPEVVSAACRNYTDWLLDRSVGNDVRLLDAPALIRAAELMSAEPPASEAVRFALADHVRGVDQEMILSHVRSTHGEDAVPDVRDFFRELTVPPSAAAQSSYVVYESAASTTSRLIVVTDSSSVSVVPVPRSRARYVRVEDPSGASMRVPEERCWDR